MRVCVVTNMFPRKQEDYAGVFVQREVRALRGVPIVDAIEVVHVDTVGGRWRYVTERRAVGRALTRFRADLVHVHFGLTLLLVQSWRGPRVVTLHGSDVAVWWKWWITRSLLRQGDRVICVARKMAERLPPWANVKVIPCGVDLGRLKEVERERARRVLGLPGEGVVIVFPGAPARREKGYGLFKDVVERLRQGGISVMALALTGYAPEDVGLVLSACDVVLYTSRHEGSPMVSKEALCLGRRVVGVDVGDLREQVSGLSGTRIVETRDSEVLARAVREVLQTEPPDRGRARQRFAIDRAAKRIAGVYGEVLGRKGGR